MVRTASTMLPLGTAAPDFQLTDYDGKLVALKDFRDRQGLLIVFMCNHCPYVKHVAPELARLADEYQQRGIAVVGISSNDIAAQPDDAPDKMKLEAQLQGYHFPYLYDAEQGRHRQQLLDFVTAYYTGAMDRLDFEPAFGVSAKELGPKVVAYSKQLVQ